MEILARAVGRRKEAVAQVQLVRGNGQFVINDKPAQVYLQNNSCSLICIKAPLQAALSLSSQNADNLNTNDIPSILPSPPTLPPSSGGVEVAGLPGFPLGQGPKKGGIQKELIKTSLPTEQSDSHNLANVPDNLVLLKFKAKKTVLEEQKGSTNGLIPNLSKGYLNIPIKENKSLFISSASSLSEPSLSPLNPLPLTPLSCFARGRGGTRSHQGGGLGENTEEQFYALHEIDVIIKVKGGGLIGQAEAIKLGLARAFCIMENSYGGGGALLRKILKTKGYLTQDSRVKERRKYGLKKARKASQYHKR